MCRVNADANNPPYCDLPAGATLQSPGKRDYNWRRVCYCGSTPTPVAKMERDVLAETRES